MVKDFVNRVLEGFGLCIISTDDVVVTRLRSRAHLPQFRLGDTVRIVNRVNVTPYSPETFVVGEIDRDILRAEWLYVATDETDPERVPFGICLHAAESELALEKRG